MNGRFLHPEAATCPRLMVVKLEHAARSFVSGQTLSGFAIFLHLQSHDHRNNCETIFVSKRCCCDEEIVHTT